ncbi:MAG: LAGLIDADG family homing endonuclease [bacterium]
MAMTSDNQTSQPSITAEGTAQFAAPVAAPAEGRRPEPIALPSETLEFFQGDELRARVFYDKYALRDPNDGRVLEPTPAEMWRRIANGLASVEPTAEARERYAGEFYWLMENFRFIPGGRIMHAIGNNKRVTALNCFPAGTKVVTRDGILPIELIKPGQEVLTHKNRFRPVTHTMHRDVDEPLRTLKFCYLGDQPVTATGNHPFYAFDGTSVKWVEAKELTASHYVKVGRIDETLPSSWDLDLANFVSTETLEDEAGMMYTATSYVGGQGARGTTLSKRLHRSIPFDERFGLWLGFFMAEGGVTDNSVYFTFNKNEKPYAEAISNLTQQLFGIEASIQHREDQPSDWMRVYVHSKLLVEFMRSLCGGATHAHNKRLPAWFLTAPTSIQKAFIAGLLSGDGVITDNHIKIFLANPDLVRQVFLLLVRLGIAPGIRWEGILKYTRHRGMWINVGTQRYVQALHAWLEGDYEYESVFEESDHNHLYKVVDGELFVKVREAGWTERSVQTVYDLTVDDDHSFVAEFVGTHNCYVLPIKEDSIEAIFEWTKEAARTYSLGGGVGGDISILRPAGAPVNNSARSSTGSVSFMELMSLTTGTIGQSGRRGALMITIADDHPDVLAFTKIKRNMDKVRYANISVRISDAFMRAVEGDQPWTLKFKNERVNVERTVQAREIWRELIYGATHHAEPGVIFWDSIKRWSTSEYNNMNVTTTNPCSLVGSTYVMTPSGIHRLDQLVQNAVTDRVSPAVLIDRRAGDAAGVAAVSADALAFTGVKRIYRVETTNGMAIRGTGDHKVKVLNDDTPDPLHGSKGWKRIDELQPGDVLAVMDPNDERLIETVFRDRSAHLHIDRDWVQPRRRDAHFGLINIPEMWDDDLAYLVGYAVGDGCYTRHNRRAELANRLDLHMNIDDAPYVKPVVDRVTGRCVQRRRVAVPAGTHVGVSDSTSVAYPLHQAEGTKRAWVSIHAAAFLRMLASLGLRPAVGHEKVVPESILTATKEATAAFLRGLIDADGTISRPGERPMVSLSSTSRKLVEQTQLLLLQFGIFSTVTTYRVDSKNHTPSGLNYVAKNGESRAYRSVRDIYKLSLGGYSSIERFVRFIGSALPRRRDALDALLAHRVRELRNVTNDTRVAAVVDEGIEEPVYDLTVLDTKSFIANGLVVSNSEIPLEPYGCCCLGNVGLQEFVLDEFSPQAQVDWPHLEHALRLATRFLDDVLDYNADKHPLPAQRAASLYSRRIGVGFTGLGDMLCKLRLKYDTKEAVDFVDRTFERIKNIVYDESVNLAIEKGAFPGYDQEQHLKGAFLKTLAPEVLERIREHGLRNVALLTVPPVGSGAALAGTTSGIEPIFDLGYTRRSESLSQEKFTVYHPLVRSYMERFGVADEEALPEFFVTAHEIEPDMRVHMQAAIQKHIDHSISSTVNCAADTTEEGVARIYFLAWKMGCKGITVYRENSRDNILTAGVGTKKATPAQAAAPATASAPLEVPHAPAATGQTRGRPKVTTGRTERIETPRGRIYVTINEDAKGICEVFVQSLDVEADAVGRLASLALRPGADPRHVIEQLWRVQSREVAIDRSSDGTVVRITTIAQAVALALGRALYGPSFRPDQVFPMADRLPAPTPKNGNGNGHGANGTNGHDQPAMAVAAPAPLSTETHEIQEPLLTFAGVCPDCGGSLAFENGCSHCRSCGYSKC